MEPKFIAFSSVMPACSPIHSSFYQILSIVLFFLGS